MSSLEMSEEALLAIHAWDNQCGSANLSFLMDVFPGQGHWNYGKFEMVYLIQRVQ